MLALRDKPPLASILQLPHCVCHHLCLQYQFLISQIPLKRLLVDSLVAKVSD